MDERALLQDLDELQKEAATTLIGPVAIHAGAGTGKTRTVTRRIAYAIASGTYNPEKVVALTYTRKAAGELRTRLAELGAPNVLARTVHSLALEQLHEFWQEVIGGKHPDPIANRLPLVEEAAAQLAVRVPHDILPLIVQEIEWRKVSLLSLDDYLEQIDKRLLPPGVGPTTIVEIMRSYEELKAKRKLVDFEDVLALVAGIIESEDYLAKRVRARHKYFTVDEYQDISPLQHALLRVWLGRENQNLCVVGDASQTIFSFAGARQNYLLGFGAEFPGAKVLKLSNNYRSSVHILAAANSLMRGLPGAIELNPAGADATLPHHEKVRAAVFATETQEYATVANAIKEQLAAGATPEQIAVLARTNYQLQEFAEYLKAAGVPVRLASDPKLFSVPIVKKAMVAIKAAAMQSHLISKQPVLQQVYDVLKSLEYSEGVCKSADQETQRQYLEQLRALVEQQCQGMTLAQISEFLLEAAGGGQEVVDSCVMLLPIHSAKGLEWDSVYLIGASEGMLPAAQALMSDSALTEELRLAYVAFTRARKKLRISLTANKKLGVEPSRFLQMAKIPLLYVQ